jgi:hypothetical protein
MPEIAAKISPQAARLVSPARFRDPRLQSMVISSRSSSQPPNFRSRTIHWPTKPGEENCNNLELSLSGRRFAPRLRTRPWARKRSTRRESRDERSARTRIRSKATTRAVAAIQGRATALRDSAGPSAAGGCFSRSRVSRLPRQLAAQVLGELLHPLEFFQHVFGEQIVIHPLQVGWNGGRKFG